MHKELRKTYVVKVEKFKILLLKHRFTETIPLQAEYAQTTEWVGFKERQKLNYIPINEGQAWGNAWDSAWFHLRATIPAEWSGKAVVARVQVNGEILVFDTNGVPIYALTNASAWDSAFVKDRYQITSCAAGGENIDLWMEAACNGLFGIERDEDPADDAPNRHGKFNGLAHDLKLSIWRQEVQDLLLDVEVLFDLMTNLPEDSPRRNKILRKLNQAVNLYAETPQNAASARNELASLINNGANKSSLTAYAIGHAHLDTGWLWPVKESIRKAARTFTHQMSLMEQYPEYIFGASQPQHFKFIQDYYPELFEKVKHYVKTGQFELQGAMWVEADCNLISGESMIRQVMWGKNYFLKEFGENVDNLWLPDVFGYSANLPQILKASGVDYFVTQKISWNQFNVFPHHTFMWRGIDGSEILSHFLPANNYNGYVTPKELIAAEERFSENDVLDEFLYLYGIGDGGGGPKDDHIEYGRRLADTEGAPKVKFAKASDFLTKIQSETANLERWVGELYLELHRGTLTSQAKIKQANRKLENWLKSLEAFASCLSYADYPHAQFHEIYPLLLVNQFHDIIPGSSIQLVYIEAHEKYTQAFAIAEQILDWISSKLCVTQNNSLVVFNSSGFNYDAPLELDLAYANNKFTHQGETLKSQLFADKVVVDLKHGIAPYSWFNLEYTPTESNVLDSINGLVLENDLVRYTFADNGQIIEGYDKEQQFKFLISGNQLNLYIDRPSNWDAWDVDYDYEEMLVQTLSANSASQVQRGEVLSSLEFSYQFSNSSFNQKISLAHNSKLLNFKNTANWHEKHKMLRVAFKTNLHGASASFDIQYGYVQRPTHRNTSWDLAKFETVAQKYADLSTHDYGVALLNDCKYGHKLFDDVIDLNLLRSPTSPDPDADMGEHDFSYAIYPHAADLAHSDVYIKASIYNTLPVIIKDHVVASTPQLPFTIESQNGVSLEVVKHAENADSLVLRFVEYRGRKSSIKLIFNQAVRICKTNLIEWDDGEESMVHELSLDLNVFELATYKIKLQ
ncbi:MAG: hypothetical protein K2Y14_12205 [Burkholderiales bacterium]|nr:hypothetical protein [Burkholderiales bacterium]